MKYSTNRLEEFAYVNAEKAPLYCAGQRLRLSEIGALDPDEVHLFLDLMGEALAVQVGMA